MKPEMALFALTFMAIMIVGFAMAFRYKKRELQHHERMAAIEKGLPLPVEEPFSRPQRSVLQTYRLRGLMWLFSGLAIMIYLFGVSVTTHRPVSISARVADANHARTMGATEDQIRAIMNEPPRNVVEPGWCLIGLIPVGVGLAYLISYRSERAAGAA